MKTIDLPIIAPIVSVPRRGVRVRVVEDEPIHARAGDDGAEVVDEGRVGGVPVQIDWRGVCSGSERAGEGEETVKGGEDEGGGGEHSWVEEEEEGDKGGEEGGDADGDGGGVGHLCLTVMRG